MTFGISENAEGQISRYEYNSARSKGSGELSNDQWKRLGDALKDTGGIDLWPGAEGRYKIMPQATRELTFDKISSGEIPYFSKPEIIFGKKFIQEHPKEAEQDMETVREVMKTSVMVYRGEHFIGSGNIFDTGEHRIVLTNDHVAGERDETNPDAGLFIRTIDGKFNRIKNTYVTLGRDLAALEPEEDIEKIVLDVGAKPLKTFQENVQFEDRFAIVGHPYGFPFEVSQVEFKSFFTDSKESVYGRQWLRFTPDERFKRLQYYPAMSEDAPFISYKGDTMPGMSGSALFTLGSQEIRVVGIVRGNIVGKKDELMIPLAGSAVTVDSVKDFFTDYNRHKKELSTSE
jgi:hypothetical protein